MKLLAGNYFKKLKSKMFLLITPIYILLLINELLYTEAYMQSVRIEDIPFGGVVVATTTKDQFGRLIEKPLLQHSTGGHSMDGAGIHASKTLHLTNRSFFNIFKIPYIVCFYAARGKWPFIPPFMQSRVDTAARTLFSQNDSYVKQFCQKWIQIKECFRPNISTTASTAEVIRTQLPNKCDCSKLQNAPEPIIYFDRDHIGNVSVDTVRSTIEFLENFLPPRPKKNKNRKNRVRSRVDEMNIE